MRTRIIVSAVLAVVLPLDLASAQALQMVTVPGSTPAPVPQVPPRDARDAPERIAADSARDLKDSHFYNRPGALPYYYNPAARWPAAPRPGCCRATFAAR